MSALPGRLLRWNALRGNGGFVGTVIGGALSQGLTSVLTQGFLNVSGKQNGLDWKQLAISMASGAIGGAIGHGLGKLFRIDIPYDSMIDQTLKRLSFSRGTALTDVLKTIVWKVLSPSTLGENFGAGLAEKC